MTVQEKSRELLREYLQTTSPEKLQEKFDKYNNMSCEGVTLYEYISLFEQNYKFIHKKPLLTIYPVLKGDFVDIIIDGEVNDLIMSKYGLYVGDNKWKIDKSFIDLTKLENKLNVKFKIIENA